MTERAHLLFGNATGHVLDDVVDDARTTCVRFCHAVTKLNGFKRELGQALIGKAHRLQTAQADGVIWKAGFDNLLFRRDDFQEPFKNSWTRSEEHTSELQQLMR